MGVFLCLALAAVLMFLGLFMSLIVAPREIDEGYEAGAATSHLIGLSLMAAGGIVGCLAAAFA